MPSEENICVCDLNRFPLSLMEQFRSSYNSFFGVRLVTAHTHTHNNGNYCVFILCIYNLIYSGMAQDCLALFLYLCSCGFKLDLVIMCQTGSAPNLLPLPQVLFLLCVLLSLTSGRPSPVTHYCRVCVFMEMGIPEGHKLSLKPLKKVSSCVSSEKRAI